MELTIELPTARLGAIVDALQREGKGVGLTVQHLAWEMAADACRDMIKYSPPMDGGSGSFAAQRKVGEGAAEHDLDRAFAVYDEPDRLVWEFNGTHYTRRKGSRAVATIESAYWDDTAGAVQRTHLSLRNSAGRVPRQSRQHWTKKRIFGGYVRTVKKHVGELKAGWLEGLRRFAARTGKSASVPAWIARHNTPSAIADNVTPEGDGAITVGNLSKDAKAIRKSQLLFVMRKRQTDADKYLALRAEKIAERIANA